MKNKAINIISYSGIVTLSQRIGKKKVQIAQAHNRGGVSLFSFLANCLLGKFDVTSVPAKIKLLYQGVQDGVEEYTSASGFIFLRTTPEAQEESSGACRVRYSFTIPRDMLENLTNSSDLGLGLYASSAKEGDPENFIAFCKLEALNNTQLALNSSLLVDWDLQISNAKEDKITNE